MIGRTDGRTVGASLLGPVVALTKDRVNGLRVRKSFVGFAEQGVHRKALALTIPEHHNRFSKNGGLIVPNCSGLKNGCDL